MQSHCNDRQPYQKTTSTNFIFAILLFSLIFFLSIIYWNMWSISPDYNPESEM